MSWKPIEPGTYDSTYVGPMPDMLYRYRGINDENYKSRLDQEVDRREIFLCPFGRLNDPMEGIYQISVHGEQQEIIEKFTRLRREAFPTESVEELDIFVKHVLRYLRESGGLAPPEITENFKRLCNELVRVACFTEDPLNRHMWRKYGRWRRNTEVEWEGGICIGYCGGEGMRIVGVAPVMYRPGVPTVDVLQLDRTPSALRDLLFVKQTRWQREREWRIASNFGIDAIGHPDLDKISRIAFDEDGLPDVIIGRRTPRCVVDYLESISSRRALPLNLLRVHEVNGELVLRPFD